MEISKKKYTRVFMSVVLFLFLVRLIFPGVMRSSQHQRSNDSIARDSQAFARSLSSDQKEGNSCIPVDSAAFTMFFNPDGSLAKHRIISVPDFQNTFADENDTQLVSASRWGVKPVENRKTAMKEKGKLVYVGSNPYFYIEPLHSSIPYLVPRAAILLQDIGRSYYDSLQLKGIPLHQIIVTSVMRSKEDVQNLRSHNGNATEHSCHMYGTTFDVSYNRYRTVEAPGENRRKVRNDTLKWVLSEVLNDMHKHNRCFIKYEINQGCFHITVR
ncbi:MAG: DUF5715 family protein [Prevotella sp.]|nr:DUF5715 family protein [Prevotella sp.]MCH3986046.1 DUF5715 family protein [Prevotella sp.]MCH3992199.1 DUF5715 family protein [Prevotella sp.]MCH4017219.1 DUF5715 family protein [Prevotella sp.]MCH4099862.1 DUF5715 family protein [Prevotella sp.]